MRTLGFIGAGNMAGAILRGILQKGFLPAESIVLYDVNPAQCKKWEAEYPVKIAQSNPALVQRCDCIILAVKPVFLQGVLQEVAPYARGKSFVSIAAGWTSERLQAALGGKESGAKVLRVSPNTPAMVGEGYSVLCEENTLDGETFQWIREMFGTLGVTDVFPERLFDAVIAVSGSSPAYGYMMIEAMGDGAVKLGLPRAAAYRAAAQAMLGAAKMVLETGEHPGKLKDDVCSPAGTTIEAVYALEQNGFRGAVIAAMEACAEKCAKLSEAETK